MTTRSKDDNRHDWLVYLQPRAEDRVAADVFARTTLADRIRATIRHPSYWADLKAYRSKHRKGKSLRGDSVKLFWEPMSPIAERWNLPATIIDKQHGIRLIEYYKHRPWRSSEPIRVIKFDSRCVLLSIDLSETALRLEQAFSKLLGWYQKDLGWAIAERNRSFQRDPFEMYDAVEQQDGNISAAAQKVFGRSFSRDHSPSYSPEAKRQYAQMKRAHLRVKKLIDQIGKDAGF